MLGVSWHLEKNLTYLRSVLVFHGILKKIWTFDLFRKGTRHFIIYWEGFKYSTFLRKCWMFHVTGVFQRLEKNSNFLHSSNYLQHVYPKYRVTMLFLQHLYCKLMSENLHVVAKNIVWRRATDKRWKKKSFERKEDFDRWSQRSRSWWWGSFPAFK